MNVIQANPVLWAVWGVSIALNISLLFTLLIKRRYQSYPAFSLYISFLVLKSMVLLTAALTDSPYFYFYGYYYGIVLEAAFLACVAFEISVSVFVTLRAIPKGVRVKFCCGLFFLVVIVLLSIFLSDRYPDRLMAIGRTVERGVASLSFGWFALLAFLSTYLRIPWRKHAFGIGAGFLVNLSVQAVGHTVFAGARFGLGQYLQMLLMLGFISSQLVWISYLWHPEPERIPISLNQAKAVRDYALKTISPGLLKAKGKFPDITN